MLGNGLGNKLKKRTAIIGVIGLGYVGLPLAAACAQGGFSTVGFDIDAAKVEGLNTGHSYIDAVPSADLAKQVTAKLFRATADFSELAGCDVIVICVPTPLTRHRAPDLSYVTFTGETIGQYLRRGQLIILESTTFPGTTQDVLKPILERGGLRSGIDFFLGFSPERQDPGNASFCTVTIPKVVAGDGLIASQLIQCFYGSVVDKVVAVSTPAVAEAVKITENVFRAVNIALVNEMKIIYDAMGIDVWEVIDAAATKPFGFMPFYPGPGLGGHCIPIDPFYLAWKAKEIGYPTRFIELAGEINVSMPRYVIDNLERALDKHSFISLGTASVLVLGLAYKKNVSDIRESPALALIQAMRERGTQVSYCDPHVPVVLPTREYQALTGLSSVELTGDLIASFDAILVATDHDAIDYGLIHSHAKLIVDTRNAFRRRGYSGSKIIHT